MGESETNSGFKGENNALQHCYISTQTCGDSSKAMHSSLICLMLCLFCKIQLQFVDLCSSDSGEAKGSSPVKT